MQGTVSRISKMSRLVAVETEVGDFTMLKPLSDCDVEIGDCISGNLRSLGESTLFNETKHESFEAVVEDCRCDHGKTVFLLQD